MMYPMWSGSNSSMINAAYSAACFWIFDSLLADALRLIICQKKRINFVNKVKLKKSPEVYSHTQIPL